MMEPKLVRCAFRSPMDVSGLRACAVESVMVSGDAAHWGGTLRLRFFLRRSVRLSLCAPLVRPGSFVRPQFKQVRLCAFSSSRFVCAPSVQAGSFVRPQFKQVRLCALSVQAGSFVRLQFGT